MDRLAIDGESPALPATAPPRQRARRRAPARRGDPSAASNPPCLLIVDDDAVAIRMLRLALSGLGEFHFARSGEEALTLARRLAPDLILLDAHMPGLNGFAVCAALKQEAAFQQVPVVFVTRCADPDTERRAFDLGAADFISKSCPLDVLQARVRKLLELKRRHGDERQLTHAHSDVEAASRMRGQMLSCIAHEISNPLNGLLGFAQLMEADERHPLPPVQAERLKLIMASGQSLRGLMRDVVDLGRFESGALAIDLQPLDAATCVATAIAMVSPLAAQADVQVSCKLQIGALQVRADAGRLQQCLVNLLTNAIKYNRRGGWVCIEVGLQAQRMSIAVRDNGLAMDLTQLAHLFEPFNRLGRQCTLTPGTGLGLWITRKLVEAMHGTLVVDSRPGEGSCFTVVLPQEPLGPTDSQ